MGEMTDHEAEVLEAAAELLREARRGVRLLDVMAEAVAAYTRDERTRRAWDAFERQLTRLGYAEDPAAYCTPCKGEGERSDVGGVLDVCMACHGRGFTGYPRGERQALGVASYAFPAHDPAEPEPTF